MSKYSEKFKDPRWQKLRLLVLEKADFRCVECLSTTKELNVHHGYYERDKEPWEYNPDTLWCLCNECHTIVQKELKAMHAELARIHPCRYAQVIKYLKKLRAPDHGGKY